MQKRTYSTLPQDQQDQIMADLHLWRSLAEPGCQSAIDQMTKCNDFNEGDQWDASLKADLEKQGKYVATIPLVRPQVNQFIGSVIADPKDIEVVDSHGGYKILADINTSLLKHAMDLNDGLQKVTQWIHRGAVTGRSFIAWMRDYTRDPEAGDLQVRVLPEFACRWDPTCRAYDLNGSCGAGDGAKYFFFDDWVDQDWAEKKWPDLVDMFPVAGGAGNFWSRMYHSVTQGLYTVLGRSGDALSSRTNYQDPDFEQTRYCLQHCWWTGYEPAWYWYDTRDSSMRPFVLTDRKQISMARELTEKNPGVYRMTKSLARVVHHTLSIGGQFIEDVVDEFELVVGNLSAIPVVQYCPAYSWGRSSGIVDDMCGPQETFNWLRSQVVNLLKLLPNTGWIIGADVDNYSQTLRETSGSAAVVIDKSKCGGSVEKIQPSPFPGGLDAISDKAKMEIRETSNIRTEAPTSDTTELSGRAILAKQASAQTGTNTYTANSDWSLRLFGKLGIDIIRCSGVYRDDEIKAIIEERRLLDDATLTEARILVAQALGIDLPQPPPMPNMALVAQADPSVKLALQGMYEKERAIYEELITKVDEIAKPMAVQSMIEAVRNPIAGQYHTSVSLSPYSVSARMSQMASLLETNQLLIAGNYAPLPEDMIIQASDLPHKEKLLKDRGLA